MLMMRVEDRCSYPEKLIYTQVYLNEYIILIIKERSLRAICVGTIVSMTTRT